ncbi:MAG: rhodanese-like domain-containing protein [Minwuiales bacterium]|nr:rhodanese-like domain-containing protein [Minwuiales bacterium]
MSRSRLITWAALFALAAAGLVAVAVPQIADRGGETGAAAATTGLITSNQAHEEAAKGRVLLIDIRTPREWRATGVPAGAARSDWWQSGGREKFLQDVLALTGDDRDRPIALICARGGRSSHALRYLKANGFTAVRDVGEGMLGSRSGPGWLARNLPTTPCAAC